MKYVIAHYVDAKDGRPANEYPLRHGPAWPSDALTASIVDRREYPAVIVGTLPNDTPLPAGATEITQAEHDELVTNYEQFWSDFQSKLQNQAAQEIREKRDRLLFYSDWIVVYSTEKNEPIPDDWSAYRQSLRDVPQQAGFPTEITWPTKPE